MLVETGNSQTLAGKIRVALDKDWDKGKIIKNRPDLHGKKSPDKSWKYTVK